MAITNGYATLVQVKARLGIGPTDTADDTTLEAMVTAVSRAIDNRCARRFWRDTSDATRYFTAQDWDVVWPGDMASVVSVATDDGSRTYSDVWEASEYELTPYDAATDGWPYTAIRVSPTGRGFPVGLARGVRVVGRWGWPSVPDAITEACCLITERLFQRRNAIFGVVGSPELGQLRGVLRLEDDSEVMALLAPYVWMGV